MIDHGSQLRFDVPNCRTSVGLLVTAMQGTRKMQVSIDTREIGTHSLCRLLGPMGISVCARTWKRRLVEMLHGHGISISYGRSPGNTCPVGRGNGQPVHRGWRCLRPLLLSMALAFLCFRIAPKPAKGRCGNDGNVPMGK